jgi:hypothetical protein
VPVVGMAWLEDMVRDGIVRSAEGYFVGGGGCDEDDGIADGGIMGEADVKGKGKEKEVDAKMADITNSKSSVQVRTGLGPNLSLIYRQSIWREYTRTETYRYPPGTISYNIA